MEDEILNKNFDDDSETENYSLNESSHVSRDEECDSILTTVQMSSSNCFIGKNGYKWNKNHAIIGRTRSHNIITHLPGLKGPAKPKPNCGIDIFNLFFTAAIIKQISEFTNAKIEEFRQRISDLTKSTYSNFTSEIEIRAFLGVLDRLRFLPIKKNGSKNLYQILVKNEINCADAFRMLTVAYGEATMDRSNVYRWYKMFSEGREDVNDEESAGRPSTSTTDEKINEVEKMILANRQITAREVAEDLNISIGSCHSIFINDLGMRQVAAKFVPKLLNCDQKQHRMNIANEMLDSVRDDPNLLQRVITGDEAWVYGYDVETKAQSSQWKLPHEPRPKKARQVRSNVKVLLTVFFDCRGVVHHEFLPQGRTVNKEYYMQVMRNLREAIRQKRPDLWKNKNWLLHHDNAPAHTSLLARNFLAKNNTLMMPQPPYSPDMTPCDFFLFPKLKRPMKGRRYAMLDEIKTASKEELKKIFKNDFLKCFEDWKNCWHKCIISHGDYFEGDKIGIHE
ncbi:hypothetical protein LAZ67_13002114 [Cordylochernes scorpioides]|uniref:Transposase n=1 Tax=Cordylochernes scorpioides TaxID=51811 RepID=A0ABY6L4D1_9ARAC|nr:hypothetical protein LAZ67_13002114 [Cordylochernes scorpioides]